MKKRIIVSDIDGVLADSSHRIRKHIKHMSYDVDQNEWVKQWIPYNTCPSILKDVPIEDGIKLFHALRDGLAVDEYRFITARGAEGHHLSHEWLRTHVTEEHFPEEWLIMQPAPIEISPGVYWEPGMKIYDPVDQKREQISALREKYEILMAIDDRPDICQAYWQMGIHALLVKFPEHDCQSLVKEEICIR